MPAKDHMLHVVFFFSLFMPSTFMPHFGASLCIGISQKQLN